MLSKSKLNGTIYIARVCDVDDSNKINLATLYDLNVIDDYSVCRIPGFD